MSAAATSPPTLRGRSAASSGFGRRLTVAVVVSAVVHAVIFLFLSRAAHAPPRPIDSSITVEVREVVKPLPPPPEPPQKAKKIERVPARVSIKPPPIQDRPPPPNQPPPKATPRAPPPIRIGVNLESTVPGGAFAAPVGNTLYGQAADKAPNPATASQPYWAPAYMAPARVSELPVVISEVRAPYPPEARKQGIEGQVVLLVTIDDEGRVARVKHVSGPGHGLDEAADQAVRQFKWKPARYNGTAVATEIRYTYTFEID